MNIHKKIMLSLSLLSLVASPAFAAVPCGSSGAGVLNVGILPVHLPYSDISGGNAIGFDPLLIEAVAKVLGFDTRSNFYRFCKSWFCTCSISFWCDYIYANSSTPLVTTSPYSTIGVVTDISNVQSSGGIPNGWQVNLGCCALASALDAAITQLVSNGTYAQILQEVRLNGWSNGRASGISTINNPLGALQEPEPFDSSEIGTIPAPCIAAGPISLPQTNCISAFLQANCNATYYVYWCDWSNYY